MSNNMDVTNKMFTLLGLLEWLEAVLDHRDEHVNEYYILFASEERYVEINIADHEIWAGAVTNYNLHHEEWLTERDILRMGIFGWVLDAIDTEEPKYVRKWPKTASTAEVVSAVLRVFTSIYLAKDAEVVEVVRGTFESGNVGWDLLL